MSQNGLRAGRAAHPLSAALPTASGAVRIPWRRTILAIFAAGCQICFLPGSSPARTPAAAAAAVAVAAVAAIVVAAAPGAGPPATAAGTPAPAGLDRRSRRPRLNPAPVRRPAGPRCSRTPAGFLRPPPFYSIG